MFATLCADLLQQVVEPFNILQQEDPSDSLDLVSLMDLCNIITAKEEEENKDGATITEETDEEHKTHPVLFLCATVIAKLLAKSVAQALLTNKYSILILFYYCFFFLLLLFEMIYFYDYEETVDEEIKNHLNSWWSTKTPTVEAIRCYILKKLRPTLSLHQIRKLCSEESVKQVFPWTG